MTILGTDNGYSDTKIIGNGIRRVFPSAISSTNLISGAAHITIDDIDYCVGIGKTALSKFDKTDSETNKVCTLTALALCGEDDYYLVVGLPIGQYKTQRLKLKETIMDYNKCKVIYRNKPFDVRIQDVTVYPQGAAVIYTINRMYGEYMIIDIGAYTIDVALISMVNGTPSIIKYDTWYKGISTLFSSIADMINNKYNITLEPKDAENVLVLEYLRIDGENVDISFIDIIINDYLSDVYDLLDLNYKTRTTDIYLCGGGAEIVFDKFKSKYPQTEIVKDSQFANAQGYYNIGLQKYYYSL
jgi:plasmid segregation protein ParM